jgi:hypothetical protein
MRARIAHGPSYARRPISSIQRGRYETDGVSTSWLKIKNPNYSQWEGRRELFEEGRDRRQRSRSGWRAPVLRLVPASERSRPKAPGV